MSTTAVAKAPFDVMAATLEKMKPEIGRALPRNMTADRVVREIAKLALSNLADVMTWDENGATLIPSAQLSPDAAAAIAEISDTRTERGGTLKVKLHNKVAALEQLAKHVGLYGGKQDGETIHVVWNE